MRRFPIPQRWLLGTMLGVLLLAGIPAGAGYVTQVDIGFDGYVQTNRWVPIRFDCENTDANTFEGELLVIQRQGFRTHTFSCPVSLPSPSRKAITLAVYLEGYSGASIDWHLLSRGRVVEEDKVTLIPSGSDDLLLPVIASRTAGVNLLNGKKTGSGAGQVRLIPYGPAALGKLPDTEYGYEAADAVLWGDLSPEGLRPAQIEALRSWVAAGGSLVVWGGAAGYQLHGTWLESLLPVRLLGQATLSEQSAFTQNFLSPIDLGQGWVITDVQALDERSAHVLLSDNGRDLIVQGSYGLGTVTFLAFDPTSPQFTAWPGAERFLEYLLTAARMYPRDFTLGFRAEEQGRSYSDREQKRDKLQELLQRDPLLLPPSFRFVSLFLLAYILIVGPINYIVLRYKKKLELTWITIPIIVLVFLGAEYILGRHMKGDRIVVNAVELLLGEAGQPVVQHQALFGLFSPAKRKYALEFDEPQARVMSAARSSLRDEAKSTAFRQTQGIRIDEHPMNMWTMDLFWAQGQLSLGDAVICDLKLTPQGISGTVENHSPLALKQPYLFWMGKYYALPEPLGAGDKINLESPLPIEPGLGDIPKNPLPLDNAVVEERARALLDFTRQVYLKQERGEAHLVARVVSDPPGGLRLGDSSFVTRSERLLCLKVNLQQEQPAIKLPYGQYRCRWIAGDDNLEQESSPGAVWFFEGEVVGEFTPAAVFSSLQRVDQLKLWVDVVNPSAIPMALEVWDWQQGRWITLVDRADQNLKRAFNLAEMENLDPLSFLRPGDNIVQVRFRVLPEEAGAPTPTPAATPEGGVPGMMPGMMPDPGMMPGMMGPGMSSHMSGVSRRSNHQKITVNRIALMLEGQTQ